MRPLSTTLVWGSIRRTCPPGSCRLPPRDPAGMHPRVHRGAGVRAQLSPASGLASATAALHRSGFGHLLHELPGAGLRGEAALSSLLEAAAGLCWGLAASERAVPPIPGTLSLPQCRWVVARDLPLSEKDVWASASWYFARSWGKEASPLGSDWTLWGCRGPGRGARRSMPQPGTSRMFARCYRGCCDPSPCTHPEAGPLGRSQAPRPPGAQDHPPSSRQPGSGMKSPALAKRPRNPAAARQPACVCVRMCVRACVCAGEQAWQRMVGKCEARSCLRDGRALECTRRPRPLGRRLVNGLPKGRRPLFPWQPTASAWLGLARVPGPREARETQGRGAWPARGCVRWREAPRSPRCQQELGPRCPACAQRLQPCKGSGPGGSGVFLSPGAGTCQGGSLLHLCRGLAAAVGTGVQHRVWGGRAPVPGVAGSPGGRSLIWGPLGWLQPASPATKAAVTRGPDPAGHLSHPRLPLAGLEPSVGQSPIATRAAQSARPPPAWQHGLQGPQPRAAAPRSKRGAQCRPGSRDRGGGAMPALPCLHRGGGAPAWCWHEQRSGIQPCSLHPHLLPASVSPELRERAHLPFSSRAAGHPQHGGQHPHGVVPGLPARGLRPGG